MKAYSIFAVLLITVFASVGQARVHKNIKVGRYDSSIDLSHHKGQPFFKFMVDVAYPEIEAQAAHRSSKSHIM